MKYSVLIPAFNAAATIAETIHSITEQTVSPIEIIVIDDGSVDATAEVAASCDSRVRVIRQKNSGSGSAVTKGIQEAACPFIAPIDADDLWLPHKMAIQLDYLEKNPECAGVFCRLKTFRENSAPQKTEIVQAGWSRITMVMRTESARQIGPMIDPPGGRGEMIDWIARARDLGIKLHMMDDVLALRRIHSDSLTFRRNSESDRSYAHVAWLAAQRKKGKQP
jgi:glycosyltransferase involved in cell wall biosynthesis